MSATKKKPLYEILIVDDDTTVLNRLENTLKCDKYRILKTSKVDEALEILHTSAISLIICDQSMPELSGLEILKKAQELHPHAPRILLTDNHDFREGINAINLAQISYFILKPWDDTLLCKIVDELTEKYQLQKDNKQLQELTLEQHQELSKAHEILRKEMQMGARIHDALLVGKPPHDYPGFDIAASTIPSKEIEGDFFEFYSPSKNMIDVVIGDVMGKGVPAALVAIAVKTQLMRFAMPYIQGKTFDHQNFWKDDLLSPKEIMSRVHSEISPQLIKLEYFVSLFYGRFDLNKHSFDYVDCGSTKPIHYSVSTNKAVMLKGESHPLGMVEQEYYHYHQQLFKDGDFFIFYSDGVTETKSPDHQLFGPERLMTIVENNAQEDAQTLLRIIQQAVLSFAQKKDFEDDLTLIIIKICPHTILKTPAFTIAQFNSDYSQLKAVRRFVHNCCIKAPGNTFKLSLQLQLAINEAFCNIVKHSYKKRTGNSIVIEFKLLEEGVFFQLSDKGLVFDPSLIPEPNFREKKESGFGWHIIKLIADTIVYIQKKAESGWNHLRIFKRFVYQEELMDIEHTIINNLLVVTPLGESLDAKDAPAFKEAVLDLVATNGITQVIFDLRHLQFIDSSGLGCFLSILRALNHQDGELKLAQISKPIRTMFELVSLHKIFETFTTIEEAVDSFKLQNK